MQPVEPANVSLPHPTRMLLMRFGDRAPGGGGGDESQSDGPFSFIEQRLIAALCDATSIGLCCLGQLLSRGDVWTPHPSLYRPSLIAFITLAIIELLSGLTLGKLVTGLRVQRALNRNAQPSVVALLARGFIRLLPASVFSLSVAMHDAAAQLIIEGIALTLLACYVPACYLMIMRIGKSMFDALAGTIVVRR